MARVSAAVQMLRRPVRLQQSLSFCAVVAATLSAVTGAEGGLRLEVVEDAGVARPGGWVRNGVPVAREWGWTNPAALRLRDAAGVLVPAQFEVLGRWAGGVASAQPIQWLHLTFPSAPAAGQTLRYEIVATAAVACVTGVTARLATNGVLVDTGVASFSIPTNCFSLFDRVVRRDANGADYAPVVSAPGSGVIRFESGVAITAGPPESVAFEHVGPLSVTVKVAGHYPRTTGPSFRYLLRYTFLAGSPGVDVDFHFDCPTDVGGGLGFEAWTTNSCFPLAGVSLFQPLAQVAPVRAYVAASTNAALEAALSASDRGVVEQHRRETRLQPARYTLSLAGTTATGGFATRPAAAVRGANGGMAAGLALMRLNEPQAIEVAATGIWLRVVSTNQLLGPRQGAACRVRLRVLAPDESFPLARDEVWAALDHPLIAWPVQKDVAASRAMGELWDGTVDSAAQRCTTALVAACTSTLAYVEAHGLHGFMTHGLLPRYYANNMLSDEVGDDTTWYSYFFGATFSDYHNTFLGAGRAFAMTGERRFLHELSVPAARRVLSTLIIQGEPGADIRTGWGTVGYGGFRKDNNSSHSYFRNLFFYYWLTADRHVLDLLAQGAASRRFGYNRRADMSLVPPEAPPISEWEETTGRMGSQRAEINWFLGHALDASYLDDFSNQVARIAARNIALLTNAAGVECCFLFETDVRHNPGSAPIQQPWMSALYPLHNLWELYREYGDCRLGADAIPISRLFAGFERFAWTVNARIPPGGDGTATGDMANAYGISWSGPRLGGAYTGHTWTYVDSDSLLYPEQKAAMCGPLMRAAAVQNMNAAVLRRAETLEAFALDHPPYSRCLDKITGEYFQNLVPAVAYRSPPLSGRVSYDGFQPGTLRVLAGASSNDWQTPFVVATTGMEPYTFEDLPYPSNYWALAFLDANGNGSLDAWEARGLWSAVPVSLTTAVNQADIRLTDPDADADAVPDWWEWQHELSFSNAADSTLDPDGDGMDNRAEFLADTNPTNSDSVLRVTSLTHTQGWFHIDWRGGLSAWQVVERKQDLLSPGQDWQPVYTNPPPTASTGSHVIQAESNLPAFFRIKAIRSNSTP
ncbi:MAG: hypothetical protein WCR06_04965 [bacterium]